MTQLQTVPLSVLMLTLNEELNLANCLENLTQWTDDVFIVDSFSTDGTVELAKKYNVQVYQHAFEGHAKQWMWGLLNLPFKHDWVFIHDPDHRTTPELRAELKNLFEQGVPPDINGIYVRRRNIFRGKWIKHGGYYPKYMLKIFRRHLARFDENEFDYRVYVPGKTLQLRSDIIEENRKEDDITFWIDKHNQFAVKQAREEILRCKPELDWFTNPSFFGTPDQRTLWLKTIWYRMPLYIRPFLYFFYRFILRRGFLDGKEGIIFHFLQGFWYRLLVDIKIDELRNRRGMRADECRKSNAVDTSNGLKTGNTEL
jgi:glycosyltransferase involved in cell wall biosynthesis